MLTVAFLLNTAANRGLGTSTAKSRIIFAAAVIIAARLLALSAIMALANLIDFAVIVLAVIIFFAAGVRLAATVLAAALFLFGVRGMSAAVGVRNWNSHSELEWIIFRRCFLSMKVFE